LRTDTHVPTVVNVTTRESKVDDFAHLALTVCGFKEYDSLIHERHWISLWICGEEKSAEVNVCMVDPDTKMIQVIKENKAARNIQRPEPQVIAEAISAFQHNNLIRQFMGLPALVQMTLPCITMVGTHPAFYLVPVTNMLSNAVLNGTYPLSRTRVRRCRCEVVGVNGGMENPAYRLMPTILCRVQGPGQELLGDVFRLIPLMHHVSCRL
ncbi:hypothetical protein EV424DRAFT_1322930, partial [Suillus variegatus]